jgi:RNA polymerase sigma-70 factor (ECF subfamily)
MRQIVEAHQERIYRLIYRLVGDVETAQDLTQETFLKALENIGTLDEGRALHRWLSQIAANLVRDRWRTRKELIEFDEGNPAFSHPGDDPGEGLEAQEMGERIQQALMELPHTYREVFLLRHVEEMSYEEIGEALDLGISAAKVRVHRARKMLRELLPEYGLLGGDTDAG